jgi:hypothetical protein
MSNTFYITTDVEIDMKDIDTDDMIDELSDRLKRGEVRDDEMRALSQLKVNLYKRQGVSLQDQMKYDLLEKAAEKYSLEQLEKMLDI